MFFGIVYCFISLKLNELDCFDSRLSSSLSTHVCVCVTQKSEQAQKTKRSHARNPTFSPCKRPPCVHTSQTFKLDTPFAYYLQAFNLGFARAVLQLITTPRLAPSLPKTILKPLWVAPFWFDMYCTCVVGDRAISTSFAQSVRSCPAAGKRRRAQRRRPRGCFSNQRLR